MRRDEIMKFIDLFAGIGGFRLPLEELGHECVQTVEIDKYAVKSYNEIFNDNVEPTDITKVNELPEHDLIVAGFPCQSFSIAGKRKGTDDPRGTLFFDICRLADKNKTKYLLLENVKGLTSHKNSDGTFTIDHMMEYLCNLGYVIDFRIFNSKDFGVPQNRERWFCLAIRGDLLKDGEVI